MGSPNNKPARIFSLHHHTSLPCTRAHQIGALLLIATTFFLTRLFDQSFSTCPPSSLNHDHSSPNVVHVSDGGSLSWPQRGYGSHLSLKIYVYEEGEIDGLKELLRGRDGKISADACLKGQWGTQVKIHRLLLESRLRTRKKEEADLFFVPAYVKCVRMMGGLNDKEINHTYVKVLSQMPYFRRSGGRDHVFVFPSGAGAHLFRSWATYINRSIILTPEADRTDKKDTSAFNTWKDIIIPGNVEDGMTKRGVAMVQPLPLSKRKYLANYLGRAQGKVGRLKLIELAKQFPDKLESPELKFSGPDKYGRIEYFQHLRDAKFCLAPRGESSWTLRFYESFFVECVPVILSDQAEFPFQNVIDYTQISIKWPSTRIGLELLEYLESIPDENIEHMLAAGRQVRCLWVYAPEIESCSAMQGIMWELQRKVRKFHQSAETFWLHNRTIVDRHLVEFSSWDPPMPLP
ncbi:EXOSTOSIN FAMILY PROTEIN [Salix viminalis]|uniref:EXOSTOSIN FAMILY PROTEIN n=1 Tax=Salix viminalis TaxID=40686 RepID=A0A9Q0UIK0_SALVM|nr:EXOSTOSIN FAMILY PROTEIN [Salix viminalis]